MSYNFFQSNTPGPRFHFDISSFVLELNREVNKPAWLFSNGLNGKQVEIVILYLPTLIRRVLVQDTDYVVLIIH